MSKMSSSNTIIEMGAGSGDVANGGDVERYRDSHTLSSRVERQRNKPTQPRSSDDGGEKVRWVGIV